MRGIVFTEFLDFVDQVAGPEMTDKMISSCDLPSGVPIPLLGHTTIRKCWIC